MGELSKVKRRTIKRDDTGCFGCEKLAYAKKLNAELTEQNERFKLMYKGFENQYYEIERLRATISLNEDEIQALTMTLANYTTEVFDKQMEATELRVAKECAEIARKCECDYDKYGSASDAIKEKFDLEEKLQTELACAEIANNLCARTAHPSRMLTM